MPRLLQLLIPVALLPWAAAQQEDDDVILEDESGTPAMTPEQFQRAGKGQQSTPKEQPAPKPVPAAPPKAEQDRAVADDEGEIPDWLLEEQTVIREAQQAAGRTTAGQQTAQRDDGPLPAGDDETTVKEDPAPLPLHYRYPIELPQRPTAVQPPAPEADQHVVSQSRMFSVSGGDSLRMGAIATRADEIHKQICNMLRLDTEWKNAISIRLLGQTTDPPRPNPVRTRVRIIGNTPNFQIRIYPGGGIDLTKLDNAIITMVLYERALRGMTPDEYPDVISLPDWLVTGIQQAALWKSGKADRSLYRNLFNRADMLAPEDIVATEKPWQLDAATKQIYDVSCGVLVLCLMDSPAGMNQLKHLLADAATAEGTPKEIIMRHFHELGVDASLLNKWWALELAALAMPRATEAMTPLESERQLAEALTLLYFDQETRTPKPLSVENAYALLEYEDWRKLLQPVVHRLVELSATCFPGYRPIVTGYTQVLADLLNGASADDVQDSLGPLQELRRGYLQAAIRGRDYLDWYEITHLGKANSRSFDAYMESMQALRKGDLQPDTQMSRYLDDIEALYRQEPNSPLPERLLKQLKAEDKPAAEEEETE